MVQIANTMFSPYNQSNYYSNNAHKCSRQTQDERKNQTQRQLSYERQPSVGYNKKKRITSKKGN